MWWVVALLARRGPLTVLSRRGPGTGLGGAARIRLRGRAGRCLLQARAAQLVAHGGVVAVGLPRVVGPGADRVAAHPRSPIRSRAPRRDPCPVLHRHACRPRRPPCPSPRHRSHPARRPRRPAAPSRTPRRSSSTQPGSSPQTIGSASSCYQTGTAIAGVAAFQCAQPSFSHLLMNIYRTSGIVVLGLFTCDWSSDPHPGSAITPAANPGSSSHAALLD